MSIAAAFAAGVASRIEFGWSRTLPVFLQAEGAECGLACIAMIAAFHGHDINLQGLRRRFSTSLKGVGLKRLIEIASSLGFDCRPLKLEMDQLRQLKCPCILHWDLDHFVVLRSVSRNGVIVHDPAHGVKQLRRAEVSERFTGIALELIPRADFRPATLRERISLRKLVGSFTGLWPALAQIFLLASVLEVFAIATPFYMQWVLDHVLISADRDLMTLLGLGFASLVAFQVLLTAARSWSVTWRRPPAFSSGAVWNPALL